MKYAILIVLAITSAAAAQSPPTFEELQDAFAICQRKGFGRPKLKPNDPSPLPADEEATCLNIRAALIKMGEEQAAKQRPVENQRLRDLEKRLGK